MFSVVVAPVTVGPASVTLIVAVAVGPLNPLDSVGGRLLDIEAARGQRAGRRRELQAGCALGQRDEAAIGDRRRAVVLVERAAGDAGNLEEGRRAVAGRRA